MISMEHISKLKLDFTLSRWVKMIYLFKIYYKDFSYAFHISHINWLIKKPSPTKEQQINTSGWSTIFTYSLNVLGIKK